MAEELSLVISNPNNGEFLKTIGWNKKEFMDLVATITEQYKGLTYTEDQMKSAKADRAKLNAMKKAISDRRIEVKNAVMAPYTQFEKEVKEVVALIEEPISMIDGQIKEYEERAKAEKRKKLEEYFGEIAAEYEFLTFDKIFDKRYLNASTSLNKAKEDIKQKVERIAADLRSIDTFASEKYRGAAKDVYMRTLNLSDALAEDKRLTEIDRKQEEERARREEERVRREEEAARKAEEARRAEEERKAAEAHQETPIGSTDSSIGHQAYAGAVSGENVAKQGEDVSKMPESVSNPSESVSKPNGNVIAPPAGNTAAADPFVPQEDTKQYKASFTVYGTRTQIMTLKQYMIDNNIKFGKVEK